MLTNKTYQRVGRLVHWKLQVIAERNWTRHKMKAIHVHGLKDLILLIGLFYPKQSTDSRQSLSASNDFFWKIF